MKELLDRAQWDFEGLEKGAEREICLRHELEREAIARHNKLSGSEMDVPIAYLEIPYDERKRDIENLKRWRNPDSREGDGFFTAAASELHEELEAAARRDRSSIGEIESIAHHLNENIEYRAFAINWDREDEALVKAFKQFLSECRPSYFSVRGLENKIPLPSRRFGKEGSGSEQKLIMEKLRAIGAHRIWKHVGGDLERALQHMSQKSNRPVYGSGVEYANAFAKFESLLVLVAKNILRT